MKLMFASDIHGSAHFCRLTLDTYKKENAEKLILLGDLLYHGPRNDLPFEYNPKEVIKLLNNFKNELLCVRGNCEAEVDQMVLEFPVMAEYMIIYLDGKMAFITHGHIHNHKTPPPINDGDLLIHGHTHIPAAEKIDNYIYLNPGSVSIPKGGYKNSYMIYENNKFTIKTFESEIIKEISIK